MSEESVLGGFAALANIAHGREHVIVIFTQKRLILATGAKTGVRTALFGTQLLGRLAAGTEAGPMKGELGRLGTMRPEEILRESSDNFDIAYDKVATMLVQPKDRWTTTISLVTDKEKFRLEATVTSVNGVRELLGGLLGSRLDFRA